MIKSFLKIACRINEMAKLDQKVRVSTPLDYSLITKIDNENRFEIRKIINDYGFILISKFGKKASYNTWLLIQHFPPEDIDFMENYLKMMERTTDFDIRNYAYLKDRILTYRHKSQIYGTQTTSKDGGETFEFQPVLDIKQIDFLREKVNLHPLKDYVKDLKEMYKKPFKLPEGYNENVVS